MPTSLNKYTANAIAAGLCSAFSSVFGKLFGTCDTTGASLVLKITCFILMVAFNTAVWVFFVKALCSCSSSLPPTVISAAANYACSALFGYFVFGEIITLFWWSGTLFMLIGLVLMANPQPESILSEKNE